VGVIEIGSGIMLISELDAGIATDRGTVFCGAEQADIIVARIRRVLQILRGLPINFD
jgi:hypothetical protein